MCEYTMCALQVCHVCAVFAVGQAQVQTCKSNPVFQRASLVWWVCRSHKALKEGAVIYNMFCHEELSGGTLHC